MRKCLFMWDGEVGQKNLEYRRGAKSYGWEDSWSDGTGRRGNSRNETSEPVLRTPSTGRVRGSS